MNLFNPNKIHDIKPSPVVIKFKENDFKLDKENKAFLDELCKEGAELCRDYNSYYKLELLITDCLETHSTEISNKRLISVKKYLDCNCKELDSLSIGSPIIESGMCDYDCRFCGITLNMIIEYI